MTVSTDVSVTFVDLDEPAGAAGLALASVDIERGLRFDDELLRRRFEAGRSAVRSVLGFALGMDGSAVHIDSGLHGKPFVTDGPFFNFSGSGKWGVVAVSWERRVGVDVEEVKDVEFSSLSRRVFVEGERAQMRAGASPLETFFQLWTIKEAVAKALGTGFSLEPDMFEVNLNGAVVKTPDGSPAHEWTAAPLDAPPGFAAAVATWPARSAGNRWIDSRPGN